MIQSVVLLSGGMDSTLTASMACEVASDVAALHLNYRHRTERRELQAFHDVCDRLRIEKRLVVGLEHLRLIGGSSLTDLSMPVKHADLDAVDVPTSYVPFRNGNFLSIAASWAEVLGARKIFIGAVEEDSSGYPDCREVFFQAFQAAINAGTRPETRIDIVTPLLHFSKREIVEESLRRRAPIDATWSCYQSSDEACGECDSCALRLRGFAEAGVIDPIPYKVRPSYHR